MSEAVLHSEGLPSTAELSDGASGQIVHLPEGVRFPGKLVSVVRTDDGLLLLPIASKAKVTIEDIRAMWAEMDSYSADPLFPEGRNQGTAETRLPIE